MTDAIAPTIYLDADACPVKDVVYKVAARYGVPLKVVANGWLRIPETAGLSAEMVTVPGARPRDHGDAGLAQLRAELLGRLGVHR